MMKTASVVSVLSCSIGADCSGSSYDIIVLIDTCDASIADSFMFRRMPICVLE